MTGQPLPVIVGFGGINAAGRASGHHAYRRTVYGALDAKRRARTLDALAALMGYPSGSPHEEEILRHTLVRRVEPEHFDVDAVPWNRRFPTESNGQPVNFDLERRYLPDQIPEDWQITPTSVTHVNVRIRGRQNFLLPTHRPLEVKAAGQLPRGFDPGKLYPSRNHPRGLQMTVFTASDALGSMGIPWEEVVSRVPADRIGVYAGSAMGQLDDAGSGGMLKSRYVGQRVTSKYCPLGFAQMPADFINAYVIGNLGSTGASLGACASFLYNLRHAVHDIRSGRSRVVLVGSAEAPVAPEVMEGYIAMGALATDEKLRALDGISDRREADHRRACRPFADNCGFTIAESSQMVVLFDDALAMELGATVYGAAAEVFVNADGFKKSIAGPGAGNYVTMAKATACIRAVLGERALRESGMVQAHGTGTPQNRVTESRILSATAKAFGIADWPVAAVKCYLGHSIGAAAGDQLASTLGIWEDGILPGIATIDRVAADVEQDGLSFSREHRERDPASIDYAIINSKGFGGNNASAAVLSPGVTGKMLRTRYGAGEWLAWERANESVRARREEYDEAMLEGAARPIYHFDHGVLQDEDVRFDGKVLRLGEQAIDLDLASPYPDMTSAD